MTYSQLVDPIWLTKPMPWNVWLLRTMILHPEQICTPADKVAWLEKYYASQAITRGGKLETWQEVRDRIEAEQWRRGRSQGVLASPGVSPLASQMRKRGAA